MNFKKSVSIDFDKEKLQLKAVGGIYDEAGSGVGASVTLDVHDVLDAIAAVGPVEKAAIDVLKKLLPAPVAPAAPAAPAA